MSAAISLILVAGAFFLLIPPIVLLVEVLAARILKFTQDTIPFEKCSIAVLIPAHNECSTIAQTIVTVRRQLEPGDRIVVVADNCTDDTAPLAKRLGADVTIRNDPTQRGKGYALDWGVKYLMDDPRDVTVVIDADCDVGEDAIRTLADVSHGTQRPAQALYLMTPPESSSLNHQLAQFAWCVKNRVRPLGLVHLNLPCQLMGTGMAFPWPVLKSLNLASGSIVEDLQLGLNLCGLGHPTLFCPKAIVTSKFPMTKKGSQTQRRRWEHGHIAQITGEAPALLWQSIRQRNYALFFLVLDLSVPPLTFLVILLLMMIAVSGAASLAGLSSTALIINVLSLLILMTAILICWPQCGSHISIREALQQLPLYFVEKFKIYFDLFNGRKSSHWVRTDRDQDDNKS